ncbi:MAG: hypothetical protein RIE08_07280 [Acidimicrobiales bacterium]
MDTELLRRVVAALDSAGIAHMVTGSFASTLHGEPRATRDIDIVIDPEGSSLDVLVEAFPTDRFYVGDVAAALAKRDMFNIIDTRSGWKVDLIVRRDRPFSRAEFDRRQPATIAGVATFVTTVEDAILSKLEWQSITPSDLQRRDVVAMMIANVERLDRSYLQRWADELGVRSVLDELWESAVAER